MHTAKARKPSHRWLNILSNHSLHNWGRRATDSIKLNKDVCNTIMIPNTHLTLPDLCVSDREFTGRNINIVAFVYFSALYFALSLPSPPEVRSHQGPGESRICPQ